MADNVTLNSGSGGETLATDDISGVQHQRVKIQYGVDGAATDVSDTNPLPIDDAGGSITVDNAGLTTIAGAVSGSEMQVDIVSAPTLTVASHAVTNAGTFAVQASQSGTWNVNNIGGTVSLPTGAATSAAQSTSNGYLATLAGAVSGSEIQVDIVSGSSSGTEYDEDAATPSTISGPTFMMERDDALSTLTPAAGDWAAARCDANGALWVNVSNADGTSTDDAAFTPGSGTGAVMFAFADESATDSVDEGDVGAVRMSLDRRLLVDADISDGGGSITVDGTVTANLGATDNAVLDSIVSALGGTLTVDGSGSTQPVSGTVTANLSATDNAVLDSIDSSLGGTLTVDGSGVTQPVSGTVTANLSATDNAVLDVISANTERGSSHYRNIDANAEDAIKGSAGVLNWVHAINLTASVAYLHLYDATAASVTPGSTTPDYTFPIPTQGDTNGAGFNLKLDQEFGTAITLVVTTTVDGSAGDPGTNGVMVNAGYS